MCATSSETPGARRLRPRHGFTVVELITVLLLVGVLAAVAVPRLDGATGLRGTAWRDQIQAAALQARSLATGHRRLVCLRVATGELRLAMASGNPASSCDTSLPGPDGDTRWAVDAQRLVVTTSPGDTLYFQPDGRVSSDGAGASTSSFSLGVVGEAPLSVVGSTGHVR